MSKEFDYTAIAQRFYAKFPVISYVSIQVSFWIVANILLGIIMHLQALIIIKTSRLPGLTRLMPIILVATIVGILYGICLGLTDYYLDKNIFRKKPLGKIILLKSATALIILVLLIAFMRFVLLDLIITPYYNKLNFTLSDKSWKYIFYTFFIYYFFMTILINFINQVNKKYGPGVLLPLLLGKYRNPKEEERIFLFMDLKSSTAMAEKLGHLEYSKFIRDCFIDINSVLSRFNAQVYQYVGDEIVVTWRADEGLKNFVCVSFFFACENQFVKNAHHYKKHYDLLPDFKAGLHMGVVTAVEIGEVKRDIAYHGDTLNTAARIQSVCNEYGKKFLISEYLLQKIDLKQAFRIETLGMIPLRGKKERIGIASVDIIEMPYGYAK